MNQFFWEIEALPNIIFETYKETRITQSDSVENDIGLSNMEILLEEKNSSNLEPMVYTRIFFLKKGEDPLISPTPVHEKSPSGILLNASSNTSHFFLFVILVPDPVLNPILPAQ